MRALALSGRSGARSAASFRKRPSGRQRPQSRGVSERPCSAPGSRARLVVSAPEMGVLKTLARVPGARGILALSFLLGLAYSFVMPFLSVFGTREVGMSAFGFGAFMTATSL